MKTITLTKGKIINGKHAGAGSTVDVEDHVAIAAVSAGWAHYTTAADAPDHTAAMTSDGSGAGLTGKPRAK